MNADGFDDKYWHTPTLQVTCRKCGAQIGDKCRTLTSGRPTDTHLARYEDRYPIGCDTQ